MTTSIFLRRFGVLLALALLTACAPTQPLPGQKVGKPYMISGKLYFPSVDFNYDETGLASWYGPGFHGKYTASGEVFNQNALTAAHPTLPMPSIVRVTNVQNGKSLLVRINDRGPFAGGRLIDLSKGSAEHLGVHGKGLAHVRVQYLHNATQEYLASRGIKPAPEFKAQERQYAGGTNDTLTIDANESGEAPVEAVQASNLEPPKPNGHKPIIHLIKSAEAAEIETKPVVGKTEPLVDTSSEAHTAVSEDKPAIPPKRAFMSGSKKTQNTVAAKGAVVQAGAFASEANAKMLAAKLESLGSVEISPAQVGQKTLYRVRVNTDSAEAFRVVERAKAAGAPDAHVVKN